MIQICYIFCSEFKWEEWKSACRPRIQLSLKICESCSQTSGASRRIAPQVCVTQQLHGWLGLGLRFGDERQNFTHKRSMWTWKRKMLRTSKQKHNKPCIWSFSWEMGLEADWCPHAAVCYAVLCYVGQAAHRRIKAGDALVIKANTKSS